MKGLEFRSDVLLKFLIATIFSAAFLSATAMALNKDLESDYSIVCTPEMNSSDEYFRMDCDVYDEDGDLDTSFDYDFEDDGSLVVNATCVSDSCTNIYEDYRECRDDLQTQKVETQKYMDWFDAVKIQKTTSDNEKEQFRVQAESCSSELEICTNKGKL